MRKVIFAVNNFRKRVPQCACMRNALYSVMQANNSGDDEIESHVGVKRWIFTVTVHSANGKKCVKFTVECTRFLSTIHAKTQRSNDSFHGSCVLTSRCVV